MIAFIDYQDVPLYKDTDYEYPITLGGVDYDLHFKWNFRFKFWTISLQKDNTYIFECKKLVEGWKLSNPDSDDGYFQLIPKQSGRGVPREVDIDVSEYFYLFYYHSILEIGD